MRRMLEFLGSDRGLLLIIGLVAAVWLVASALVVEIR
jgi:hypothetical protein